MPEYFELPDEDPEEKPPKWVGAIDEPEHQSRMLPKEFRRLKKGKEIKPDSSLITLTPFVDPGARLICVGGRLGYCNFPKDIKHPILLPPLHQVTRAITQREHLLLRHASAERTLVAVHRKYWIPRGRASVNNIIKDCFDCKRFRAKPNIPLMSPFPTHRL